MSEILRSFNSNGLYSTKAPLKVCPVAGNGSTPRLPFCVKLTGWIALSTKGSTTPFFLKFQPYRLAQYQS